MIFVTVSDPEVTLGFPHSERVPTDPGHKDKPSVTPLKVPK